jgi:hypothetical protein
VALARFLDKLKFVMRTWPERSYIRRIVESDNYRFLKFAPPGHFYSPIPDIKEVQAKLRIVSDHALTEIPGVDLNIQGQVKLAREFSEYHAGIPFPDKKQEGFRYYLDNEYFSYGDAVVLYSMLLRFKPKRVIEVGSGFSSAAMLDVNEKYFNNEIDFTFIEPFPDRLLSLLKHNDAERYKILRAPVQEIPYGLFGQLCENDILFVDSSHVAKMGSDVVHLLFNILPSLNRGVLVHFHDILWPFEYPSLWVNDGRAWNEAYILRAFLQYNNAFRILYFNSMMQTHSGQFLGIKLPLAMRTPSWPLTPSNTSLWLRKVQ